MIWFIPAVNVDGYNLVKTNFNDENKKYVRKNRKILGKCSNDLDFGIDLNRNYLIAFGIDEEGSSSNPC